MGTKRTEASVGLRQRTDSMGELIRLAERRAAREARAGQRAAPARVEFLFDLSCPFSYLAAERVDRIFDEVTWTPASNFALCCGSLAADRDGLAEYRLEAERRALELRLPLIWPERFPEDVPAAMRAAHYASEQGRGAAFVLAAGRLAFCGGFDLDAPELLAEAAAAAGIDMQGWLHALGELHRDGEIEAAGRALLAAGADRLPALRVGDALFAGEHRIDEAAVAARHLAARATGATG
jgi:2-hydroxychromene-2-carboxylate isomerase